MARKQFVPVQYEEGDFERASPASIVEYMTKMVRACRTRACLWHTACMRGGMWLKAARRRDGSRWHVVGRGRWRRQMEASRWWRAA